MLDLEAAEPGDGTGEIVVVGAEERPLEVRRGQARALDRARDRRLLGGELGHLGVVQEPFSPNTRPRTGVDGDLRLEALARGAPDIGRELDRIRLAVGLDLDVAPVDIVSGEVRGQPAVQPAALQADLVVGEIVRAGARGNDEIVRVDVLTLPACAL